VIGYNASAGLFTLYNPWGFDQPGVLSWSQLQATCDGFVVADATGSAPISGANLHAPVAAAAAGGVATSPGSATNAAISALWTTVPVAGTAAAAGPAATGSSFENHLATIFPEGPSRHVPGTEASGKPLAAGVDAVLAGEDFAM
jgi:hypothetical protein